ncbi:MAG: hypothetical protein QW517_03575, partial [Thermofilaceae archaeon]
GRSRGPARATRGRAAGRRTGDGALKGASRLPPRAAAAPMTPSPAIPRRSREAREAEGRAPRGKPMKGEMSTRRGT